MPFEDLKKMAVGTYERVKADCLQHPKVKFDTTALAFPDDAQEHYKELWEATKVYRTGFGPHSVPAGYSGPWLENRWIERFVDKPLSSFGGFIPLFLQWTDIHVLSFTDCPNPGGLDRNTQKTIHETIMKMLRPSVLYVTVTQDDQGLFQMTWKAPNVISLSQGGYGSIPIPLLQGELPYRTPFTPSNSSAHNPDGVGNYDRRQLPAQVDSMKKFPIDMGFYGTHNNFPWRARLIREISHEAHTHKMHVRVVKSPAWMDDISNTKFNLCPRGFGRTSYRMSEVIQMGRLPVYMFDDVPWLPYIGTNASIDNLGWVAYRPYRTLVNRLAQTSDEEITRKLEAVKKYRSAYTYEGVLDQLELFFKEPLGQSNPDCFIRRCVPLPPKDHR